MITATRATQLKRLWQRRCRAGLEVEAAARRQAEQERAEAHVLVVELQQAAAVRVIAASAAHDFNNFLTVIMASAADIGDPSVDKAELTAAILEACTRSSRLVRQLQELTAPHKSEPVALDLCELVLTLEASISRLVARHVDFKVEVSSDGCFVLADPTELQQLVLNLCINAGHALAGRRYGVLTLRVMNKNGGVELQVEDDGCGIAESDQAHVFDAFFTTRGDAGGTGLGLHSAKLITERAHGTITLTSVVNYGTVVHVLLPHAGQIPIQTEARQSRARLKTAG